MSTRLRLLIASHDSQFALELSQRIRKAWELEIEFDIVQDARRALSDFKEHLHPLVFTSEILPGADGDTLAREIARMSGETTVFVFGGAKTASEINIERVVFPVVNWTELLGRFRNALPDIFRDRIGGQSRDPIRLKELETYAAKYRLTAGETGRTPRSLALLPSFYQRTNQNEKPLSIDLTKGATQADHSQMVSIPTTRSFDFLVTFGLVAAAAALQLWSESEKVVSLKNIFWVLSIVAILGVTLGRSIENLYLKLKQNEGAPLNIQSAPKDIN